MSRKDYEAFAKIIAHELQGLRENGMNALSSQTPHRRACMALLVTIAEGMCDTFYTDNLRFDEDRFMGACGFTYLPPRDEYSLAARWGI
tara:strand:- start:453 stop:719 length:267 start_codon:yes stop_codon:yes gene_type:complete